MPHPNNTDISSILHSIILDVYSTTFTKWSTTLAYNTITYNHTLSRHIFRVDYYVFIYVLFTIPSTARVSTTPHCKIENK